MNGSSRKTALGIAFLAGVLGCSGSNAPAGAPPSARPTLVVNTTTDLDAYRARRPVATGGSHTRSRLAAGCNNCWTNVTITSYDWARFYGSDNFPNPGDQPVLVGHIRNNGTLKTVMYNLEPSTVAEYDVYIVNENGAPGWALLEVPTGPSGQLKFTGNGKFAACAGHPTKPKNSTSDFRNCDYGARQSQPLNLASVSGWEQLISRALKKAMPASLEDPGWFSCSDGCCTLSTT